MAIDRSKFKASKQADVEQQDAAAAAITGKTGKRNNLTIEDGTNRFRIYPAHPDGGGTSYAEPVSRVFLPAMVVEKDDKGNEVIDTRTRRPKMKETQKPVFNSKLHAGTPKDLVEEYQKLALSKAEDIDDEKERANFENKIKGVYNDNPAFRFPGLTYQNSFAMYADKLNSTGVSPDSLGFGILDVRKTVKDKMNVAAAIETANDPIGMDPYSDSDLGLPVIIIKNKQVPGGAKIKPQDIYQAAVDKSFNRATKTLVEYPLSDDQLEKLEKMPSLAKLYKNSFKKSDFELQLAGLELFDQKYAVGIFDTDEFMAIAEEISGYYPDEVAPSVAEAQAIIDNAGEEESLDEGPTADQFDVMTRLELKAYISKNKLPISLTTKMSDDDVRGLIREAVPSIPNEPLPGEKGHTEPTPVAEVKTTPAATGGGQSAKDRLAALRAGKK